MRSHESGEISGPARGFTFLEMIVVIVILGILSTVAMRAVDNAMEKGRYEATMEEMDQLAEAIVGNPELYSAGMRTDFGYFGDVGSMPSTLDALVTNPGYGTWDGPYVVRDFTQDPNGFKTDAWGTLYSYSGGMTITSTGSGSSIQKNIAGSLSDLSSNTVRGTVLDGLGNPPGGAASAVTVRITHPSGSGGYTTRNTNPSASGAFSFTNQIPVGNHQVLGIYTATDDTASVYVSVLPNSTVTLNLRVPGDHWGSSGGGGAGGLTLVAGSAQVTGGGKNVEFQVENNTGSIISITTIKAEYDTYAFYEQIFIGVDKVFDSSNPRGASGETKTFAVEDIADGSQVTIKYRTFKDAQYGAAGNVNMTGSSFTITFSDGSVVSFSV